MRIEKTREEYLEEIAQKNDSFRRLSEPLYQCPWCGGIVRRDLTVMLPTFPPQFKYVCDDCSYEEIM